MEQQDAWQEYSNSIRALRRQCLENGMSDDDFKKIYLDSLQSLNTINQELRSPGTHRRILTRGRVLFISVVTLLFVGYNFKLLYSCLVCSLQDYVYPGLRILRRLSIPLISLFPSLTDLYHESCLLQNPFFTVVDMDCWPCSSVTNVREINDPMPVLQQHTAPFIYETDQDVINLEKLRNLYIKNKYNFDTESSKVLVNYKYYISPEEMFSADPQKYEQNLFIWKLNNMKVARILRQVVQRPKAVPKFGQTTERFIIVHSGQEAAYIPDTECNFSFLLSLSGSRVVTLKPAEECKLQCKTLRIELKETYLLWYNWWYWRPTIQSSGDNSTFIGHIGSYC